MAPAEGFGHRHQHPRVTSLSVDFQHLILPLSLQGLPGSRLGVPAEGDGQQPADPTHLTLPQRADRPLALAGQLLLPGPAGCHVPVRMAHTDPAVPHWEMTRSIPAVCWDPSSALRCVKHDTDSLLRVSSPSVLKEQ